MIDFPLKQPLDVALLNLAGFHMAVDGLERNAQLLGNPWPAELVFELVDI